MTFNQKISFKGFDTNIKFLDKDDSFNTNKQMYISQSFASGAAFTVDVLDSVIASVNIEAFWEKVLSYFILLFIFEKRPISMRTRWLWPEHWSQEA